MSATDGSVGLHFIVSTDVKKTDADTRKLIRSHVMLGKNRRKSRRVNGQGVRSLTVMVDPNQTSRTSMNKSTEEEYSVIPQRVGSDLSLAKLADDIKPIIFGDIMTYFSISVRVMFPLAPVIGFDSKDKTWLDPLTIDAAYLHVTVFAAESFIDKVLGRQNRTINQDATLHLLQGVRLLRERLLLGDEEAKVSDSTIWIVLTLATNAHVMGEYDTAKQHMEGLRKIVSLRGGVAVFKGTKLLMLMLGCDIGMALHSGSEPLFFKNSFLEPFVPYPDLKLRSVRKSAGTISSECDSGKILNELDEELGIAWAAMQRFCSLVNLAAETQRTISPEIIQDAMASVMYRLLQMHFKSGSADEAIRLGLLSLSYHVFLQWQDIKLSYIHFTSAYRDSLLDLKIMDNFPSQIMLWLLMVGGISIFTVSDDSWLKYSLQEYINMCQITSWNEMRDILKSFMWIRLLHDKPGKDIFDFVLAM